MRRPFWVVAAVVVLIPLTWLIFTAANKYIQPKPSVVPACKRIAAHYPLPSHRVCVEKMGCPPDYKRGPVAANDVNGENFLLCCPEGYSANFVKNAVGKYIDVECTKDP